jgi:hypothetical protein
VSCYSNCVISLHYHENVYYHSISVHVSAVQCRFLLSMFCTLFLYIQVREHAAGVLASLMKGIDEDLSKDFRERSYAQAQHIFVARRR